MLNNVRSIASCFVALSFAVAACGDGDGDGGGAGGGAGKGGSAGSSGATGKGGSSGSTGKGGSSGSTGKGGSAGSGGSTSGTGGSSAGTSGSAGADSGGEGGDDTGSGGGDAGTGNGSGGAGDGGMPGAGGTPGSGGDDGAGGAPEGGMGGEPSIGAGGNGTAGEGGAPVIGPGGAGGEGGAPVIEQDVIDNPGFEDTDGNNVPPHHWTVTAAEGSEGSATYSWSNTYAHATQSPEGPGYLDLWLGSAYTVDVSQVVSPIADGSYTLSIWHYGGPYTEQYVYVSGYDESNPEAQLKANTVANSAFVEIRIENIPVTSGQIKIGIYSVGAANNWSHFDDVSLTLNPE